MAMHQHKMKARLAAQADLDFVSQDGHLPREVVARKIDQHECFLVEMDRQPVGYLWLEYLWSLVPYIAIIQVQEEHRKQGCSRVLLDFVIQCLQEQGHHWLYSSSQADEPEPQAWHRHMGFKECGVINGINEGGVGEIFFRRTF
jgi:predicted GNAT superfamily acetyltransferase